MRQVASDDDHDDFDDNYDYGHRNRFHNILCKIHKQID